MLTIYCALKYPFNNILAEYSNLSNSLGVRTNLIELKHCVLLRLIIDRALNATSHVLPYSTVYRTVEELRGSALKHWKALLVSNQLIVCCVSCVGVNVQTPNFGRLFTLDQTWSLESGLNSAVVFGLSLVVLCAQKLLFD